eukprot:6374552-Amphidinium_carterae.1
MSSPWDGVKSILSGQDLKLLARATERNALPKERSMRSRSLLLAGGMVVGGRADTIQINII